MREHAKAKLRAKVRGPLVLVFRLASIGVRLRTAPAPRGAGVSALALRTSASRPTRTTCVQCGLFNYLTIRLFCFRFFGDASIAGADRSLVGMCAVGGSTHTQTGTCPSSCCFPTSVDYQITVEFECVKDRKSHDN